MAYYNGNPRTGKPEVTQVICDNCSKDKIKFDKYGQQEKPWRWSPIWGRACDNCGKQC